MARITSRGDAPLVVRGRGRGVETSASYRRTAHCYACDGTGRVRLLADGRPEPGYGWGRPDFVPPPPVANPRAA